MTVDTRPQIHEGVVTSSPFIDFDKPPQTIEEYKFGESITRNNFAHFLIDSFAKSRGNVAAQAYYWKWLEVHLNTNIPTIIRNFIDKQGLSCLTEDERALIGSAYQRVGSHVRAKDLETDNDRSFSYTFSQQLDNVLMAYQNRDKKVFLKTAGRVMKSKEMDRILAMEKSDFLHWLATASKEYH